MFSEDIILALNEPVVILLREISRLRGSISKSADDEVKDNLKHYNNELINLYNELKTSAETNNIKFKTY